jgi:hypothetical protein
LDVVPKEAVFVEELQTKVGENIRVSVEFIMIYGKYLKHTGLPPFNFK